MPSRAWRIALVAVMISAVTRGAAAQNIGGSLNGTVVDAGGGHIKGAVVGVVHAETSLARTATSDDAGRFRLVGLPPGEYRFEVSAPGFAVRRQHVQIAAGQTVVRDVTMEIAAAHDTVDVTASRVQRESPELGGVVDRELVLGLPVNGRSYEQLALLEPGVVSTTSREGKVLYQHGLKININGAGSRSNAFLLDGTAVTDLYNNGLGSAAGTFLGLEAVREFQVLTSSYQAALGGVSGGIVSIITKSGSQQFHGSLFGMARDGRLDAKNYFDAEKPAFWRRQGGASLGGPLVHDRAVFFATGEWLRESMGITQVTTVPSIAARNGLLPDPLRPGSSIAVNPLVAPFLALFPIPNGRDLGDGLAEHRFVATRPTRDAFGQGRIDLALGRGNSLFARFTADGAKKFEPARYPGSAVDWESTARFLTVEDSHVLSAAALNTARFSYSFTDLSQTDTTGRNAAGDLSLVPGRGLPHLMIGGMPAFGTLVSPYTRARQRLLGISEEVAFSKGSHLFKVGGVAEHIDALVDFQIFWPGRYSFADVSQFLQARPSVLSLALAGSESLRELSTNQFAVYVQDEVKLSSRLTLSGGVRWERATAPSEANGRLVGLPDPLHDATPTVGTLLKTPTGNFGPRGGIAWTPLRNGRTVIRGGAGVYYDINTLPFVAQTVGTNPPFYNQVTIRNPVFRKADLPAATVLSLGVPQYDWQTPRMAHFNAAVEREFRGRVTVSAAYAGSRGSHLVRSGDINAPVADVLPDGTRVFAAGRPRRNPAFGAIDYRSPDGHSRHDALQVRLARRFDGALQFQASYTLARTIDESQGTVPTESNGSVTARMDPDFTATDRGPADFDRRHNLTAYIVWKSPRLSYAPVTLRSVAGGWTVSGILALRSGNPFTVGIQEDYSRTLARVSVDRPNFRPGVNPDDIVLGGADRYFEPSAFILQAPGTFGNVGRNSLTAPGLATVDVAMAKPFAARWGKRGGDVQVRLDVFNLLNRVNLGMPQRIVFAGVRQDESPISSAGRITSTTTGPRELQVGVRVSW